MHLTPLLRGGQVRTWLIALCFPISKDGHGAGKVLVVFEKSFLSRPSGCRALQVHDLQIVTRERRNDGDSNAARSTTGIRTLGLTAVSLR